MASGLTADLPTPSAPSTPPTVASTEEVISETRPLKPRKIALSVGFVGTGYHGLQISYEEGVRTIEGELHNALATIGALGREKHKARIEKLNWSRSSRTDSGVHAQVVVLSAKLFVDDSNVRGLVDAANALLPEGIRIFDAIKIPRSFEAQKSCAWREYIYVLPRDVCGDLALFKQALSELEGAHSYHNFSNVKGRDIDIKTTHRAEKKRERNGEEVGETKRRRISDTNISPVEKEEERENWKPAWHKVCILEGDEYRRKPDKVFLHTNGSVYRMRCEEVDDGKCLEVRIRGQFFLYNQIRIMVGTALAVSHKVLPLEVIPLALKTRLDAHLPLAPATGLCLCVAGFSNFDLRAGKCALTHDIWNKTFFGEPTLENVPDDERGFILMSPSAVSACDAFYVSRIRPAIMEGWKSNKWYESCLARVEWTNAVHTGMQADVDAILAKEKSTTESRREGERKRRNDLLQQALCGYVETGGLPAQCPTVLLCNFEVFPGPKFTKLQLEICRRIAAEESLDATNEDILRLVEECGLASLIGD